MIMKIRLITLVIGVAGSLSLGLFRVSADMEVSVGVSIHATTEFYEPLATSGTWVEVGSYGRCWHPAGVAVEWRPYCSGNWEWTDSGWYWVSDEPWGWACYHYGTWFSDPNYGWVWIPGVEWAPAWVSWRVGGDHIGWAPCGPPGFIVAPTFFVFVESRHFNDRIRRDTVIVNNTTIINKTIEINATRREKRQFDGKSQTVVVNEGPRVDVVEKATGKKFAAVSIREADRKTIASVPEKLKHQNAEPAPDKKTRAIQEQPNPATGHKLTTGANPEVPDNIPSTKKMPSQKAIPPERIVPQTPPEKVIPSPNKETPPNTEKRHPNEIVPPHQATPGQSVPRENPDQGGGQGDDKKKDKDNGGGNP
jgi:hypothetical protein